MFQVRQVDIWDVAVRDLHPDTFERIYSRCSYYNRDQAKAIFPIRMTYLDVYMTRNPHKNSSSLAQVRAASGGQECHQALEGHSGQENILFFFPHSILPRPGHSRSSPPSTTACPLLSSLGTGPAASSSPGTSQSSPPWQRWA